ncbi:MAG: radical SAM protein [Planctomycetota bacterium]|nr:MAG: radical SAM protein [Planctomycetota bacterium]
MEYRDYRFLGMTQSLCPQCMEVIPAKILDRGGRVYFRKRCPTHGVREDFVCSDVRWYDRNEHSVPARKPVQFGTTPDRGCPLDCGLCTEHEQHTCIGLVELTEACNLTCPMCFAASAPGRRHVPLDDCLRAVDRLVEVEGRAEVLQLSGGEPTIAPHFASVVRYAMEQPIDYVQVNTNGIRLATDAELVEFLAQFRHRLEIFFQLDGLTETAGVALRGRELLAVKLRALERVGDAGLNVTLAVTLQAGVNEDQIGPLVQFAAERPFITAINFQPATYSGRYALPDQLEQRVTFPDVIRAVESQTDGMFQAKDFLPLPCAHPNCHQIAYAWRSPTGLVPMQRMLDIENHIDLLANGISFTRPAARKLVSEYLQRQACCGGSCSSDSKDTAAEPVAVVPATRMPGRRSEDGSRVDENGDGALNAVAKDNAMPAADERLARDFIAATMAQRLGAKDMFRITITSFLDAYNFDVRRVMKCCTHHVLPSGHVIPFCAYNTLYRPGHVPLPKIG